jgi:hypothetical protein
MAITLEEIKQLKIGDCLDIKLKTSREDFYTVKVIEVFTNSLVLSESRLLTPERYNLKSTPSELFSFTELYSMNKDYYIDKTEEPNPIQDESDYYALKEIRSKRD